MVLKISQARKARYLENVSELFPDVPLEVANTVIDMYCSDPKEFARAVKELKTIIQKPGGDLILQSMKVISEGTEEHQKIMSSTFSTAQNDLSTTNSISDESGTPTLTPESSAGAIQE